MNKAKKIAVALGLLTLPFFTGAWTQAQAQQQEEQPSTAEENTTGNGIALYVSDAIKEAYLSNKDPNFVLGQSTVFYSFKIEQAGLMGTDRINYEFSTIQGAGPEVRIKVLYFWGNNTIKCGGEVTVGPFTVGSNAYTGTLWCDHGGVPTSSETSNKRWNCNFAAISFQMKLNGEIVTKKFVLNWDDGDKSDSFWYNEYYRNTTKYTDMLSSWDNWD